MDVDELAWSSSYTGWAINWYTKNGLRLVVKFLIMTMLIIMTIITIMCECEIVCLLKLDADDFSDFTLGARPGHAQHRRHFILVLPCWSSR